MANSAYSVVNLVTQTANQTAVGGTVNDPIIAIANNPQLPGAGSVTLPHGNTAARVLTLGAMRLNTQTGFFECSTDGATWSNLAVGGGGIASVTGTALQIDCTAGPNVVVSIDPGYLGQNSITTLGTITTGVWHGTAVDETHGGTNQTTYALGDTLYASAANTLSKLAGNITNVKQYLSQTGTGAVSAAPAWATISGGDITGAALTKVDDTNVTLTLGGTPATALLRAASITAGWTGQLSLARGGTAASLTADNGAIVYSTAGALALLASTATANQVLLSGVHAAPSWSTTTYPTTSVLGDVVYASAANVLSTLAGNTTAVKQYLSQTGTGVISAAPSWATISGGDITGAALTKVDDTNVTLTLGGTPATALLRASSITAGWTGQLSLARGGSNADLSAAVSNGGIVWTNATQMQVLAGTATASKMLLSGSTATPSWSTSTIPSSAGATVGKVLSSDGTNYVLSTATFPVASATAGKFIQSDGTNWIASTPTLPTTAGSAGKILRSDGTNWLSTTSTFADTYSASNLLYSNGANTVTGLATANSAVLVTSSAGVPAWSGTMTNGQLIIGSTGATPTAATLTAGTGVTITNAAGSITINATSGAGAYVFIGTASASSSASVAFTNLSSTYQSYVVTYSNVAPATNDTAMIVRVSTDNGSTYINSSYRYVINSVFDTPTTITDGSASATGMILQSVTASDGIGNGSNQSASGYFQIFNVASTSLKKLIGVCTYTNTAGRLGNSNASGIYAGATTAVNAIQILMSSGNIASGEFRLYGLTNS